MEGGWDERWIGGMVDAMADAYVTFLLVDSLAICDPGEVMAMSDCDEAEAPTLRLLLQLGLLSENSV